VAVAQRLARFRLRQFARQNVRAKISAHFIRIGGSLKNLVLVRVIGANSSEGPLRSSRFIAKISA
jgi:hypothetical protein